MDWSNRFTLGGFTVTYSTFQMAWDCYLKDSINRESFGYYGNVPSPCRISQI